MPSRLRGQPSQCGGVAFWQLNEPWPAVSWAVIDRAGRPKAAYRDASARISADPDRRTLPLAALRGG